MPVEPVHPDRPVKEKISWAEHCFEEFGDRLLRNGGIAEHLVQLRSAIQESRWSMAESGIVDECRDCDRREGGSCCGAGLEHHYSGIILLINLLLGVDVPKRRHDPAGCFFLGEKGCTLLARHVICVNYLCKRINDRILPEKIAALRKKEGIELETLFMLQESIRNQLNCTRLYTTAPIQA